MFRIPIQLGLYFDRNIFVYLKSCSERLITDIYIYRQQLLFCRFFPSEPFWLAQASKTDQIMQAKQVLALESHCTTGSPFVIHQPNFPRNQVKFVYVYLPLKIMSVAVYLRLHHVSGI